MNKQIYTITELSEELNQARQNVRRRLIKLDIQAINEYDREYKTDPLEYDYQALISLAEDFGVVLRTSFSTTNEQASTTKAQANEQAKNDIIEVLKDQLELMYLSIETWSIIQLTNTITGFFRTGSRPARRRWHR